MRTSDREVPFSGRWGERWLKRKRCAGRAPDDKKPGELVVARRLLPSLPMTQVYEARGTNRPGGAAHIQALQAEIAFDGSEGMGESVPGPAHLLAAALAACVLKNVERFSHILRYEYSEAVVEVALTRQNKPPRIISAVYKLSIRTSESEKRSELLHRNIRKHGTITNTLEAACEVTGSLELSR